jgi:hypothetical protein
MEQKKKYKFKSCCEVVHFTPVEQLFNKKQLQRIADMDIQPHQCHYNSWQMSFYFNCGYCDGIFCGCMDHAFNYVIRKGQIHYFDITAYRQHRSSEESGVTVVALRRYAANDIIRVVNDVHMAFVTTSLNYTETLGHFTISDSGEIVKMDSTEANLELTKKKMDLYEKAIRMEQQKKQ